MSVTSTSRPATMDEMQAEINRLHEGHARIYDENKKLRRVLKASVEFVCAPAWAGVSDEDCELERVLRECGYVRAAA